ncbi:hypothetical protein CEXT_246951 [Caerostris extrusa]|uniref:Uncharacterized protein n=1 Tax=Caerostris extrusa TaxID=172846 RepID=A0AAV4N9J0_CAEEX|nr:hypothetical protein CEXT_246951 [Caerostris extrusa]
MLKGWCRTRILSLTLLQLANTVKQNWVEDFLTYTTVKLKWVEDFVRLLLKQSTSLQWNKRENHVKRSRTCIVLLTELQVRWARRARKKTRDGACRRAAFERVVSAHCAAALWQAARVLGRKAGRIDRVLRSAERSLTANRSRVFVILIGLGSGNASLSSFGHCPGGSYLIKSSQSLSNNVFIYLLLILSVPYNPSKLISGKDYAAKEDAHIDYPVTPLEWQLHSYNHYHHLICCSGFHPNKKLEKCRALLYSNVPEGKGPFWIHNFGMTPFGRFGNIFRSLLRLGIGNCHFKNLEEDSRH